MHPNTHEHRSPRGPKRRGSLSRILRDFMYGMAGYEFERHLLEERAALETLFMITTIGDMIGIPVLPPYYSLRLLPFVTPSVSTWKRRVLRERETTEDHEFDLHGV